MKALEELYDQIKAQRLNKLAVKELDKAGLGVLGLLIILLTDADGQILTKTMKIIEIAILEYPFDLDAEDSIFFTHIDSILAALVDCLSNESFRIQDRVIITLTRIAKNENISLSTMLWDITKGDISSNSEIHILAKLRLLQELVKQEGPKDKSNIGKRVIDFGIFGVGHPSEDIKNEAIKLITECKNLLGNERMNELMKNIDEKEKAKLLYPPEDQSPKTCDYCGKSGIPSEEALDWHLYKICPMLMHCPECGFILEIANLNYHLLSECREKIQYQECDNCKEAIKTEKFDMHDQNECIRAEPGAIKCVKCHDNVKPGTIKAWKQHILGKKCKKNKNNET